MESVSALRFCGPHKSADARSFPRVCHVPAATDCRVCGIITWALFHKDESKELEKNTVRILAQQVCS
ncbi:hypothetical protein IG631_05319 [Alternaria alternata]|nr:hypothetical protein IG631_05319 [Alternaria alternata]